VTGGGCLDEAAGTRAHEVRRDRPREDDRCSLAKAIDRYTEESVKEIGRTKAQALKAIKKLPSPT
jgi:hypothetical protein